MKYVYTRLLSDEEMRPHLERGDTIVFQGLSAAWQEIELQVENLDFGDTYAVSRTRQRGAAGEQNFIRASPLRARS